MLSDSNSQPDTEVKQQCTTEEMFSNDFYYQHVLIYLQSIYTKQEIYKNNQFGYYYQNNLLSSTDKHDMQTVQEKTSEKEIKEVQTSKEKTTNINKDEATNC